MTSELLHLMADLADEAAAACVAVSCALVAREDGDWHDTATLRGTASADEFQRGLSYLDLRGRLVRHPSQSGLVRIMDSGARPPAEADAAGEPDVLRLARRYAWDFAQYTTQNSAEAKRAVERSFKSLAAACAARDHIAAHGDLYDEVDCMGARPMQFPLSHGQADTRQAGITHSARNCSTLNPGPDGDPWSEIAAFG